MGRMGREKSPHYRLKTPSEIVKKVILLEAHGVETSVIEEVYQVRESTIRTKLTRGGEHGRKLHEHFFRNLLLEHVQLDELWGNVKRSAAEVWVWWESLGIILAVRFWFGFVSNMWRLKRIELFIESSTTFWMNI
jgi:hypothetical protein